MPQLTTPPSWPPHTRGPLSMVTCHIMIFSQLTLHLPTCSQNTGRRPLLQSRRHPQQCQGSLSAGDGGPGGAGDHYPAGPDGGAGVAPLLRHLQLLLPRVLLPQHQRARADQVRPGPGPELDNREIVLT